MGDDPATSVVDGFGRSHDVPNLFIFDGSTWPTSSGMNPTATIAAMALRSAEHLIETRNTMRGRGVRHLDALADLLIPGEDGMPSASEAGATGRWLDAVLAARPDLRAPLEGLDLPPASPPRRRSPRCPSATPRAGRAHLRDRRRLLLQPRGVRADRLRRAARDPLGPPDHEDLLGSVSRAGPVYRPTP